MVKTSEIKIPKDQIKCESIQDNNKNIVQVITSDVMKTKWFLYDVVGGKLVKVETGSSPLIENRLKPGGKDLLA